MRVLKPKSSKIHILYKGNQFHLLFFLDDSDVDDDSPDDFLFQAVSADAAVNCD